MSDPPSEANLPACPELVVVGELNVDLILERVNALPELERERIVQGMMLTLGSSSAILASNASALGLRTGFIGRVGCDDFGQYVLDRLHARKVETQHVIRTEGAETGLTVVFTYGSQRGAMTYPGAMDRLTLQDIPWDYVAGARHLHLSSFYLQQGLRPDVPELFRRAKSYGLTTSFDTNWDPAERWGPDVFDVLDHVDVFLPNEAEARRISGADDLEGALDVLARHAGTVVVTRGAAGIVARQGAETIRLPARRVATVDEIGAGDSFTAGFLARYMRGERLEACLHLGLAAGAYSTTRAGGTAAFDDIAAFMAFAAEDAAACVPAPC